MEKCSFGQRRSVEAATVSFHQTRLHGIQECIRLSVTTVKAKKKEKKGERLREKRSRRGSCLSGPVAAEPSQMYLNAPFLSPHREMSAPPAPCLQTNTAGPDVSAAVNSRVRPPRSCAPIPANGRSFFSLPPSLPRWRRSGSPLISVTYISWHAVIFSRRPCHLARSGAANALAPVDPCKP